MHFICSLRTGWATSAFFRMGTKTRKLIQLWNEKKWVIFQFVRNINFEIIAKQCHWCVNNNFYHIHFLPYHSNTRSHLFNFQHLFISFDPFLVLSTRLRIHVSVFRHERVKFYFGGLKMRWIIIGLSQMEWIYLKKKSMEMQQRCNPKSKQWKMRTKEMHFWFCPCYSFTNNCIALWCFL